MQYMSHVLPSVLLQQRMTVLTSSFPYGTQDWMLFSFCWKCLCLLQWNQRCTKERAFLEAWLLVDTSGEGGTHPRVYTALTEMIEWQKCADTFEDFRGNVLLFRCRGPYRKLRRLCRMWVVVVSWDPSGPREFQFACRVGAVSPQACWRSDCCQILVEVT